MNQEIKKGYASLKHDLEYWKEREPDRAGEWQSHFEWALNRAQQYADKLGTDRETVLAAWESKRDYWYVNYYKEIHLPDLDKAGGTPVMMYDEWMAEGKRRFGENQLDWRYKCPCCGHVQTPRQFREAGIDPNDAICNCASRYNLGGKESCKWTTGGLLRIGGVYVVTKDYHPVLAFAFADEEKKED